MMIITMANTCRQQTLNLLSVSHKRLHLSSLAAAADATEDQLALWQIWARGRRNSKDLGAKNNSEVQ
jgi:hypothetical protein